MSRGRWSTDTVDARGAWMTQHITSYLRNPGLQKPCSWDIEDGFLTMTHGENARICSMEQPNSERPRANVDVTCHTHVASHAAWICAQLNRKLTWDPAKRMFLHDEEANRMRS